ncbi:MAG: hypothetical protein ACKVUS_11575 [Saprospiraceae bacterium]
MKDLRFQFPLTMLLLLSFALASVGDASAQGSSAGAAPSHNCGVFQKLGGIPDGFGGQVYYDRFGNTWTEDEIADLASDVQDECDAGVFKLSFSGDYTIFGGVELVGGGLDEGYTDWDRYLYKKNGPNNYTKLIISANDPNCCGKQQKNPNAPTAFPGDCEVNIIVWDGSDEIAEVSRNDPNDTDVSGINNRLSHLDIACAPVAQAINM